MRHLALLELRTALPRFVFVYLTLMIFAIFGKLQHVFFLAPAFCVFLFSGTLLRSNWYLNLPWSRARLAFFIAAQSAIVLLFNFATSASILAFVDRILHLENPEFPSGEVLFSMMLLGCLSFVLSVPALCFSGRQRRVPSPKAQLKMTLLFSAGIIVIIGVIWQTRLFSEPLLYCTVLLAIPFLFVYMLAAQVSLPQIHFRKVGKTSAGLFLFSAAVSFIGLLVFAHFGPVASGWTHRSLLLLNNAPVGLTETRVKDLFINSRAQAEPAITKQMHFLRRNIDQSSWENRTRKCLTQGCLELSSMAVDRETLSPSQMAERFLTLQHACRFDFDGAGQVRCKGTALEPGSLNSWLADLEKKGVLAQWLQEDDEQHLLVAMKGLGMSYRDDQATRINQLTKHSSAKIADSAKEVIATRSQIEQHLKMCASQQPVRKKTCKDNRYPAGFFD